MCGLRIANAKNSMNRMLARSPATDQHWQSVQRSRRNPGNAGNDGAAHGRITHGAHAALSLPRCQPACADSRVARERAVEVFSQLRVWDTERNNGVLMYLLLADRSVEIVADRGIHATVKPREWEVVCREMGAALRGEIPEDADWAEVVDKLDAALRSAD